MRTEVDLDRITISVKQDFIEKIKSHAKKEKRSVSQLCRLALEKYFEELDRP